MKKIILVKQVKVPVTDKQLKYIKDLMAYKRLNTAYRDNLALNAKKRLSKRSASRLIDCLITGQKFEFLQGS
jgi:hypothetical protein